MDNSASPEAQGVLYGGDADELADEYSSQSIIPTIWRGGRITMSKLRSQPPPPESLFREILE
jgi:hypothetical protein